MKKINLCKVINVETVSYVFFGILTTIVDAGVFYVFNNILKFQYIIATIIAWIAAVLFAYITNKIYVFKSLNKNIITVLKEMGLFLIARILSLVFTIIWMFITVDYFHIDEFVSKLLANIFVVIMNYLFSKILIFKSKN